MTLSTTYAARAAARLFACVCLLAAMASAATTPEQLIEHGRWKQARVIVEQKYKSNPQDAHTLYLLARIRFAFGETNAALDFAKRAVALNGNKAEYHLALAEIQGEIAQKANLFRQAMLARGIKKELETAAALDPKNVDARIGLMEYYLQAPSIAGGDRTRARAIAEEIFRLDPVEGYMAQASIARYEKQTDKLEKLYLKAIEASPKSSAAHLALARLYASESQKAYDRAEQQLRAALKLDSGRVNAYVAMVSLLALRNDWVALDATLVAAEKNVADNLEPYFQAARVLAGNDRDLPRAERYLRKYLSQEPEGGAPSLAFAHWKLGQVYQKMGRKQEAVAELQTALRMNPELDEARKELTRLR
ncbi:MAG TPA: tetratricopeptide repeat protein [Clostridia bacterium]|nr:tetratricopeptide repeat protein [Clostridia bacterium]